MSDPVLATTSGLGSLLDQRVASLEDEVRQLRLANANAERKLEAIEAFIVGRFGALGEPSKDEVAERIVTDFVSRSRSLDRGRRMAKP